MTKWQLQEAKARFSEVVKSSREGPQEITVHGRPAAVLVSKEAYDKLIGGKPGLVEFLRKSPLHGVTLNLERDRSSARKIRL